MCNEHTRSVTSSERIVNGNKPGYLDELSAVEICLYEFVGR